MKVLSWSQKLSIGDSRNIVKIRKTKSSELKSTKKTGLKKSVSSLSKFLSSTPLRSLRGRSWSSSSKCSVASDDSPVLLPLTIRLDTNIIAANRRRPRSHTLCADKSELRNILQQRFTQRIMERSMAAVILEARHQLEEENTNPQENDVYVPCEFNRNAIHARQKLPKKEEEDAYMTMS